MALTFVFASGLGRTHILFDVLNDLPSDVNAGRLLNAS